MEHLPQIEAVRIIEQRINSIEIKINNLAGVKQEYNFKDMLVEKISGYGSSLGKSAENIKGSSRQVVNNLGNKIIDGIKDSELLNEIMSACENLSSEFGVDPDLVKAIIKVESNFNPLATSHMGAMGLMQLMPSTSEGLGIQNPYDIYENLSGGITLMKNLIESFGGDLKLALAAYNAGSSKVKQYGQIPPIEETQNYVRKVLSVYNPDLL